MKFSYSSGTRPLDGYTIKRGIGIGGFGEVYFALSDAGKEVALKRILRNTDIELRGVKHCLNLKHNNLINLFDIRYDENDEAWVVMEYVAGESLTDVIDRHPEGMPKAEVQAWFTAIAGGVDYLHGHGIVHRDLKPGNIFTDEETVKIGDYGLAKFISHSRHGQTESVGTFHYMAPEIGKGDYGKEIDIYALGVVLYEMLTGRLPFDGESSQEIIMRHLTDRADVAGIEEPYGSVITRALAKDPARRYASVQEMSQHLNQATAGALVGSAVGATALQEAPVSKSSSVRRPPADIVLSDVRDSRRPSAPQVIHITEDQAEPPLDAELIAPEPQGEPLLTAAAGAWRKVQSWWSRDSLGVGSKALILIGLTLFAIANFLWLGGAALVSGVTYSCYYLAWALGRKSEPATVTAGSPFTSTSNSVYQGEAPVMTFVDKSHRLRDRLRRRSVAERAIELARSLLTAAAVVAIATLAAIALSGINLASGSVGAWSFAGWAAITGLAGVWTVLTVTKFWEGQKEETVMRRFGLLTLGLAIGAGSFFLAQYLSHPSDTLASGQALFANLYPAGMYAADSITPLLPAYLVQFAVQFGMVRWWRQADPLRRRRFSFFSVIGAMFVSLLLPFPQPWGLLLAAIISVAVQLSAPWINAPPPERA